MMRQDSDTTSQSDGAEHGNLRIMSIRLHWKFSEGEFGEVFRWVIATGLQNQSKCLSHVYFSIIIE